MKIVTCNAIAFTKWFFLVQVDGGWVGEERAVGDK